MGRKSSGKDTVYINERKQKNGEIYVMELTKRWDPVKKNMVYVSSRLLGKKTSPDSEIVKTRYKAKPHKQKALFKDSIEDTSAVPSATSAAAVPTATAAPAVPTAPAAHASAASGDNTSNIIDVSNISMNATRHSAMELLLFAENKAGLKEDIESVVADISIADKIRSLGLFVNLNDGQSFTGIYHDQLHHDYPYTDGITEAVYNNLFDNLGHDYSTIHRFFAARVSRYVKEHPGETIYVAYDATIVPTESEKLNSRWTITKEGSFSKAEKVMALYTLDNHPLALFKVPANINDESFAQYATEYLRSLGVTDYILVTDNGFMKKANITQYEKDGVNYLGRISNSLSLVKEYFPEDPFEFELEPKCCCEYDPFVSCKKIQISNESFIKAFLGDDDEIDESILSKPHFLYIFSERNRNQEIFQKISLEAKAILKLSNDNSLLTEEQIKFRDKYLILTENGQWDINSRAITKYSREFGCFVLLSNVDLTPDQALQLYRKRNGVEYFYKEHKKHADGATTKVQDDNRYMGRLFVQFYALSIRESLLRLIRQCKEKLSEFIKTNENVPGKKTIVKEHKSLLSWLNNKSLYELIKWFDCPETLHLKNAIACARFTPEMTKRDKMFFQYIGLIES